MRVDMTFFPRSPYLHTFFYCFLEPPSINLSLRIFNSVDLMELPYINDWFETSLKNLVISTMVKPEMLYVSYQSMFGK
jgi:Ca2+-dependent lipid-binding protein